jgi:hypothetical protein
MIHPQDRSFIGRTAPGIKRWQSQRGYAQVGNSNDVKVNHAMDEKSLPDYLSGVGNRNSQSKPVAITGSFTLYDVTPANLAFLLNAKVNSVAAGPVTGEARPTAGEEGEHIVFKNLVDSTAAVSILVPPATASAVAELGNVGNGTIGAVAINGSVAGAYAVTLTSETAFNVTGPGATAIGSGTVGVEFVGGGLTFTITAGATPFAADDAFTVTVAAGTAAEAGVDYIVTHYGIQIMAGSSIGASGIVADYVKLAADVVEVLTQAAGEYSLHFPGMNDAQNGAPHDITLHRVKFKLITELPVSGTEYAALAVNYECLTDYTIQGDALSKFYRIRMVKPAA